VIAFSADPRERAEIEALGVDRWLSKPVRVDELVEMIGGLCQDDQARGPRRLAAV
jgi:CheY-like chemotaxis protein